MKKKILSAFLTIGMFISIVMPNASASEPVVIEEEAYQGIAVSGVAVSYDNPQPVSDVAVSYDNPQPVSDVAVSYDNPQPVSDVAVSYDTPQPVSDVQVSEDIQSSTNPDEWEYGDAPIGIANVGVSVNVSKNFSLASVAKNTNIYAADKKSVLFTIGTGDSLLIRNENQDSKWTAVLIIDNEGDHIAYMLTSNLSKNAQKKIRSRNISKVDEYCVAADSNKSYAIYAKPSSSSEKIGVLRKAIVLPVVKKGDKFTAVLTQNGIGYLRNDYLVVIENNDSGSSEVAVESPKIG